MLSDSSRPKGGFENKNILINTLYKKNHSDINPVIGDVGRIMGQEKTENTTWFAWEVEEKYNCNVKNIRYGLSRVIH